LPQASSPVKNKAVRYGISAAAYGPNTPGRQGPDPGGASNA
jgi:hypothetical protein